MIKKFAHSRGKSQTIAVLDYASNSTENIRRVQSERMVMGVASLLAPLIPISLSVPPASPPIECSIIFH